MNVHRMRRYFSELSLRSTTRTTRRTKGGLISSPLHPSDPGPGVDHKAPLAGANGAQNAAEAAQLATALSYHHQPRPRPNHGGKDAEEACEIGEEKRPQAPRDDGSAGATPRTMPITRLYFRLRRRARYRWKALNESFQNLQ